MKKFVVLDTETTGLDDDAEIIEIAIIDHDGRVLLDTRVKCQGEMPASATRIHGITEKDLVDAPSWKDIHDDVITILSNAESVVIYNATFDLNMIFFTAQRHGFCIRDELNAIESKTSCAMLRYAKKYNDCRWSKLSYAAYELGVSSKDIRLHSAVGDCELTRRLWLKIQSNEERKVRQRESRQSAMSRKRALIPANVDKYPYFGLKRPEGYVTLSKLKISELDLFEYAGTCRSSYGDPGHLFKPKEKK